VQVLLRGIALVVLGPFAHNAFANLTMLSCLNMARSGRCAKSRCVNRWSIGSMSSVSSR